jgi:hypothetical protein
MELSTRASIDLTGPAGLALLGPSIRSDNSRDFRMVGDTWSFGPAHITELTVTELEYEASAGSPFVSAPAHDVTIVFVLDGSVHTRTTNEGGLIFVAGTAAVLEPGQLPALSCDAGTHLLFVTAPQHPDHPETSTPGRLSALLAATVRNEPALDFYLALIRTVRTHSIAARSSGAIIIRLMDSLLAADQAGAMEPAMKDAARISALIAEHSTDPSFGPRSLARHLRIPPRDLDEVVGMRTLGERAATLIAQHRLVHAMALLQPSTRLTIEEVAILSGHRSSQHLEAAVQSVYGLDASALLATQRHPTSTPTPDDGGPQRRISTNL